MHEYRLLIDGALVGAPRTLDVINPATGEIFATCPRADEGLLNRDVAAAKTAFPSWAARNHDDRSALVHELANALEANTSTFARLLVQEQGKPLAVAEHEMAQSIGMLRTIAGIELSVEVLRDSADARITEHRSPLGVVAAITPWNFPMLLLMVKVAPALVSGNCLVIKPAPTTPLTALRFGELCRDIMPAGVVNIIVDANDLGALLTSHPDVAKVAFTGSTETGRKVMASASPTLKRLTLELGGNDAALVLADADPKKVAASLFRGAMINSGQICIGIKRAYVPDEIYDEVCDALATIAQSAVVDDGFAQSVQLGPLQNKAQYDKVLEMIAEAGGDGTIIAGGSSIDRPGYFISPTIVRDVNDDARIVREEQFGPVLPVLRYSNLDDAIRRVNDSPFGLAASIWGRNVDQAQRVAEKIDAGTVWINKVIDLPHDIPFRGAKQSGLGVEYGREGLKEYTQAKVINTNLAEA